MDKENSPDDDFADNDLCAINKLHLVFLIIIIHQISSRVRTDFAVLEGAVDASCLSQSLDLVLTR